MYYPSLVHNILVYEMPWVLNAAWKVIRSWLPGMLFHKTDCPNRNNKRRPCILAISSCPLFSSGSY